MSKSDNLGDFLTSVANALRTKLGSHAPIHPQDFDTCILALEGGDNVVGVGGIEEGFNVTFSVEGEDYALFSVQSGGSVPRPTNPSRTGYHFTGWYTAAAGGTRITFPYTPSANVTLYAGWSDQVTTVGFTGLTRSDGVLTWTDDIASCTGYTTTTVDFNVNVQNDLDDYFPFSEIAEMTDADGNTFVKFPKIWVNWITDASGYIDGIRISNVRIDEYSFIPDCFLDPKNTTCTTYLDYFALGKYEASGSISKMYSKSGQTCLLAITRADSRSAARAYGVEGNYYNGYQLEDFSMLAVYNFLCMMYYKTSNIQTVYGGRTGSGTHTGWNYYEPTGSCDDIPGLNGWNKVTDCVKMLGIENPYGHCGKWIDGVFFDKAQIFAHRLPQYYSDSTTNSVLLDFTRVLITSRYIQFLKKGGSLTTRSYVYANVASGTSSAEYTGDISSNTESGTVLFAGGSNTGGDYAGLWALYGRLTESGTYGYVGARLAYRPVN